MQVGTKLRDARRSRNLTIHDISRATKISERLLESIDRNDMAAVPGDFFVRAFLKAYAAEVGLDPAQIVREYVEQLPPDAVQSVEPSKAPAASRFRVTSLVLTLVVGVTAAFGTFGLVFNQMRSRDSAPSPSSRPAATSPGVGLMETSGAGNVKPVDTPEESSSTSAGARSSKPGESGTSAARGADRRPRQSKPAPRAPVRRGKPIASEPSEPRATETPNPPATELPPIEASPATPPDETSPNQSPVQ
jgi:cytoskeleton protein RodZ